MCVCVCVCVCISVCVFICACILSHSGMSDYVTPCTIAHQVPLSMYSPSKNIAVGCHFLFQRIFPNQGLNSCLLHRHTGWQILSHWATLGALHLPLCWSPLAFQKPFCCNLSEVSEKLVLLILRSIRSPLVAQMIKNSPATQIWHQFFGQEDPLKKEMATHSCILAWRIPWQRGLWSMGSQIVIHG